MFCANSDKRLSVLFAMKISHRISTTERERVLLCQFVPELFKPNGGFDLALGPQQRNHFSKYGDFGICAFQQGPGSGNCPTDYLKEASAVWHPFHHDFRENFGSVQRNVPSLPTGLLGVQTASRQPMLKSVAGHLGGDDDCSIAGAESGTDKVTQRFNERKALVIEINNMLASKLTVSLPLKRQIPRARAQIAGSHFDSPA